eukprot:466219-Amphidinium_carterae.1
MESERVRAHIDRDTTTLSMELEAVPHVYVFRGIPSAIDEAMSMKAPSRIAKIVARSCPRPIITMSSWLLDAKNVCSSCSSA